MSRSWPRNWTPSFLSRREQSIFFGLYSQNLKFCGNRDLQKSVKIKNIVITFIRDITKHKRVKRHQGLNSPTRIIDIAKTEQNRQNPPYTQVENVSNLCTCQRK